MECMSRVEAILLGFFMFWVYPRVVCKLFLGRQGEYVMFVFAGQKFRSRDSIFEFEIA